MAGKVELTLQITPFEDTTNLIELGKKIQAKGIEGLKWSKPPEKKLLMKGLDCLEMVCTIDKSIGHVDEVKEAIETAFESEVQSVNIVSSKEI